MRNRAYMASVAAAALLAFPTLVAAQDSSMEQDANQQMQEQESGSGEMGAGGQGGTGTGSEMGAGDSGSSGTGQTEMGGTDTGQSGMGDSGGFVTSVSGESVPVENLKGYSVLGADGEQVGEVTEVMVSQDGKVEAIVISSGGFLGLGEKSYAIEWSGAEVDSEKQEIQTQLTQQEIENAPEYEGQPESGGSTE